MLSLALQMKRYTSIPDFPDIYYSTMIFVLVLGNTYLLSVFPRLFSSSSTAYKTKGFLVNFSIKSSEEFFSRAGL